MGSRLRIELDFTQGFDDTGSTGRNMSEQQPGSYEAPSVEEIDNGDHLINTVAGTSQPQT